MKEGPEGPDPLNPFNLKSVPRKSNSPPSDSSGEGNNTPIAKVQLRKVATKENATNDLDDDDFAELLEKEKDSPREGVQLKKVKKKEPYERESFRKEKENNPLAGVKLRKTSVQTKEPQQNGEEKEKFFVKPQLKPVPQREKTPPAKDHLLHDLPKLNSVAERKLPERRPSRNAYDEIDEIDRELPAKRNSLVRGESVRKLSSVPSAPPMPPPPPAMPGMDMKPLTDKQAKKLDLLRARPKVRPDWSQTLKEIEGGKKLRHVECNDRSQPLLPEAKAQEHFLYASEKPNVHNELLKQIEFGIKLKSVKTNDRSKPMLEGLRKFRRQMTIEEQIQKSMSMASLPPVSDEIAPEEVDELDDIDKVRDDLQSTKQMLALELRNKEAQEMENRRLMARLANLEVELEKAKAGGGQGKPSSAADDRVIQSLKKENEQARKNSEQVEKKYTEAVKQLDTTKLQFEDAKRKNFELEKKLMDALAGKRVSISHSRQNSVANGDGDDEFGDDETEEESDGEDTPEKREKKLQKEVKLLGNKLRNFKNKEDNARKERIALKEIIKKNQAAIKDEKKKYNKIKKEVDKMTALLSEDEDEDDEEKEEEEEEEVEEEEESSEEETESESDSDDSDSEKSLSEPEDAPLEKKKTNLQSRGKRHEARLNSLKKGNFLLKTNAERLQDDLNKQKEMTAGLQEDLDSVLSELG